MPQLIEFEEARRIVIESCAPLAPEPVPLDLALGRALAEQITSDVAIPAFDNSAMDGFAVRAEDTASAAEGEPVTLRVAGESRAGSPAERPVGKGRPSGSRPARSSRRARTPILRQEDAARRETDRDREAGRAGHAHPLGRRGREAGDAVSWHPARRSVAAELGVLASIGRDPVPCRRRPTLTLIGTGDELVDPGEEIRPGQIRDTNGVALTALAEQAGADVDRQRRVGDDPNATSAVLAEAIRGDVTVICGGVSVGLHDHVRPALEELGTEQLFWGVALRPGRPTWFGLSGGGPGSGGGLVFGLPGNPVSAVVTFLLFVRPALRSLAGLDPSTARTTAVLDEPYEKRAGRTHAVRVSLRLDDDGWHATPTRPEQASHILTSMLGANALAMVPAGSEGVAAGETVEVELI